MCALPAPADHAHGLLTFIEHHKIRVLRFASRQRQKTAGFQIPKHPDAIFRCACQWVIVVRPDRTRSVKCTSSLLSGRLGCTERSVMLARTTITSSPRSVNDVEVRSISNLLVDQWGLLPVRAMECQLFV